MTKPELDAVVAAYNASVAAGDPITPTSATVTDLGSLTFAQGQNFAAAGCARLVDASGNTYDVPLPFVSVTA